MLYWLVYGWVKLHALLPMRILYGFSTLIYFVAYRMLRYRVKVVRRNLAGCGPENTCAAREVVARGVDGPYAE